MASKKPWRTVIISEETGRFTREQIDAVVLAVKERSERRAAAARKKVDSSTSRAGTAAGSSGEAPKAA